MSDVANSVGDEVFRTFRGNNNLISRNVQQQKAVSQPVQTVQTVQTPQAPTKEGKKNKINIDKAMPYIATGTSVAAIGVSAAAIATSVKNSKQLTKQIKTLEQSIKSGEGAVTQEKVKNATSFVIGILGAATGGAIVNHFDSNKDALKSIGMTDDEIKNAKTKAESAVLERENKISKIEATASDAVKRSNEADAKAQNAENKANGIDGKANQAIDTANAAMSRVNSVSNQANLAMKIHRQPWHGLNLMVVNNNEKYMNKSKIQSAMDDIHTAVIYRIGRKNGQTQQIVSDYRKKYVPLMKSNAIWALTAEFDPIKAGGLGSVPMELQNNFTDMGIDNPVFIPMYQQKGKAEFIEYGDEKTGKSYKYIYGGETFNLKKMAEVPVQQYRGSKVINQNVEFYVGHIKRQGLDGKKVENPDQRIIFVKNTDNFGGDIYTNNFNADEPEKFAFFSKAVYQLAEAKVSQALGKPKTGLGEIKVIDKEAYDSVKPPVSMILNDWHAASMAGLLRYKAPMENAYNVIDDDVKDALRDMPLLMIGHNAGISGGTRNDSIERSDFVTENIVNTLYDQYAYGIAENASTGSEYSSVDNAVVYEKDNENDRQFNNLAHGISLSDYFVPVSKNYEKELKSGKQASGMAFDILKRRSGNDSIIGEVNGLDRALNTTEAKAGWLKSKFGINLQTYNHFTPIDEVMEARQHNKMEFYDNFLKPIMDKEPPKGGFKYQSIGEPAQISREDFEQAPMITFAHRLTDQKGLGMFQKAVQELFNTWDEKHPGKPKPVIIAGGELEEVHERQFLEALKNPDNYTNPEDVKRIQVLQGFMPNPSLYSATTYFCAPSTFEPCGLTQGECYAMGTPIITTATGGFVDTVKDGVNGFVAEYEGSFANDIKNHNLKGTEHEQNWFQHYGHKLCDKFNEGMDVYFNDKDKYKSIVKNNLKTNLSWNRGTEDDPIHGYINRLQITQEDMIEANVASERQYILPMVKEFDKLQKGGKLASNSKIMDVINNNNNAADKANAVFEGVIASNSDKQTKLEQKINKIDELSNDYNAKISIDENDSSSKGKLENITLKRNMESENLNTILTANRVAEKDRAMFDKMIELSKQSAAGNKVDTKSPEYAELNSWKDEIISKYAA